MKTFVALFFLSIIFAHGQDLAIPAVAAGMGNNYFKAGTGDGGTLSTYNSFLRLHYGLAIGSPYVSNGSGGYVEKATISFDGRTGNISTLGNVGIGTSVPDAKLAVKGTIHAQEVKVDLSVLGPDYVFEENYNLPSLTDTENYIKQNKHLPEVPSACEMEEKGINLSEMNMLLLKKVEELTLYLLQQQKVNDEQSREIKALTAKIENINK